MHSITKLIGYKIPIIFSRVMMTKAAISRVRVIELSIDGEELKAPLTLDQFHSKVIQMVCVYTEPHYLCC